MPLHQPFDKSLLFPTVAQVTVISLAVLLIPIAPILQSWTQSEKELREFLISQRRPLLVLIGILMLPASMMGRRKLGGSENSLGLALFFFFLLALLSEISAFRATSFADLLSANEIKLWTLPLLIACIVGLGSADTRPSRRAQLVGFNRPSTIRANIPARFTSRSFHWPS
jgi:hypothetical protein